MYTCVYMINILWLFIERNAIQQQEWTIATTSKKIDKTAMIMMRERCYIQKLPKNVILCTLQKQAKTN